MWVLRKLARRYGTATWARYVSGALLGVVAILGTLMFLDEARGARPALPLLGGDYGQFYAIGTLFREAGPGRLYDFALQDEILHRARPRMPADEGLPFVYPPFVAAAFRPLAWPGFAVSFASWIAITVAIYGLTLAIALRTAPNFTRADQITAASLALAFEPFAMECVLGGQLAAVGALAVAGALACESRGRTALAGLCLAGLAYKPTLLWLVLPLMILGGRWRGLIGFAAGVASLAAVSVLLTGPGPCLDFLDRLVGYARMGGSGGKVFKTVKYVDLNAFLKLMGMPQELIRPIWLAATLPLVATLASAWRRANRMGGEARALSLAAAVAWTPVLNLYGPVYDATLIVPALILWAGAVRREHPESWPADFLGTIAVLGVSAWASPILANVGFQALTLGLVAVAVPMTRRALRLSMIGESR